MNTYTFTRSARSPRALTLVALWWIALLDLYITVNAAPIVVLLLACASLPALFDIGAGANSELRITDAEITWRSGRRGAKLPRGQLKSARLDTRLDFSLRLTLLTYQGGKIRLPYECVPPALELEAALLIQNIPFERHHFSLMS